MRTASQIIVKKDYSKNEITSSFFENKELWTKLLRIAFVVLLTLAGLGEWKTLNNMLGGLPKAITAGIICLTIAYMIIFPDIKKLREILLPTLVSMSFIIALLLWSMVIWMMNFMNLSSMIRGSSKLVFQSMAILTAISGVYLFGSEAINMFTLGACLANAGIMILEVPSFGVVASLQSLITCLITFGEADGYARNLEIHDLTFVFGQLVIYYLVFAPRKTRREKNFRIVAILACSFFFMVGMKRIAIPAAILFAIISAILKNRKNLKPIFILVGICWIIFFFLYIYGVRTGTVSKILNIVGIDMMGRDYLWKMAGEYYEFSIGYMGHGFEYVDTIVGKWYSAGLINHPYPFHNDILKVFVELGFPGLCIWSGLQYLIYPIFWMKYADDQTTLLYLAELGYMTMTYLTDNTAFYFWSTMALRIIVMSYSVERKKPPKKQVWKPRDKKEMREHIRILMQEG